MTWRRGGESSCSMRPAGGDQLGAAVAVDAPEAPGWLTARASVRLWRKHLGPGRRSTWPSPALTVGQTMTAKRVYIAFDYDDLDVKQGLVAQSRLENCPFDFEDNSISRAFPERWAAEARRLIRASDCVIVLCGEQTHQATGVATELQIAQDEGKRYFLIQATRSGAPTRPRHARADDKVWSSRWPTVRTLLEGDTPPGDAGR